MLMNNSGNFPSVTLGIFQSTLLQEERPYYNKQPIMTDYPSIHAPTRGATGAYIQTPVYIKISIHAPTRGATCIITVIQTWTIFQSTLLQEERLDGHNFPCLPIIFQSTLLQEERHSRQSGKPKSLLISIHAPTRGATNQNLSNKTVGIISIHAPTRGATLFICIFKIWDRFQSTLLQEERQLQFHLLMVLMLFQSTLLQEERRVAFLINSSNGIISIHAPTRGATYVPQVELSNFHHFNPRSYKRSDGEALGTGAYIIDFNPRSYKRSDIIANDKDLRPAYISIHAPTRGAT